MAGCAKQHRDWAACLRDWQHVSVTGSMSQGLAACLRDLAACLRDWQHVSGTAQHVLGTGQHVSGTGQHVSICNKLSCSLNILIKFLWTFTCLCIRKYKLLKVYVTSYIIISRHQSGPDRPVSSSSTSLFKGLPSRLRPFALQFSTIFAILLLLILCVFSSQFDLYVLSFLWPGSAFNFCQTSSVLLRSIGMQPAALLKFFCILKGTRTHIKPSPIAFSLYASQTEHI